MASSSLGVGWGILTQKRIQAITEVLTAEQKINRRLIFLQRTPITPVATDADLLGEFEGEIYAADVVMQDQQATVHDFGKFRFFRNEIANLKHGILLGQRQLDDLDALRNRGDEAARFIDTWISRRVSALIAGIRLRLEALIVSCYRDNTVYDRYGVKINGTWGTPSELKYVVPAPWNDPINSRPVTDLQFMMNEVAPDMDTEFTIVTMSRKAFKHMVMSKEFQDKAKIIPTADLQLNFLFPDGALPNAFDARVGRLAEAVVGCRFEFYENKITEKTDDGGSVKRRILPHNELLLHSPAVWNNREVIDVGNGVPTESLVAEITQSSIIGGLRGRQYGPLGYAAPTTIDFNPPGVTIWEVMRAFPRKFDKKATGLMDIGINPVTGA